MPTLDGLRGLACLLVVISHLLPSNTIGGFGVILFFSLSGFLMGVLYLDKVYDQSNGVKFIISRVSRITPAYYISITFYVIVYTVLPDNNVLTAFDISRAYLFVGSFSVFWSIPPEVQFYVFFIGLWYSIHSFMQKYYLPLIILSIVTTFFILTREAWPGISLPSKLHIFLMGTLGAYLFKNEKNLSNLKNPFVQIFFIVMCLAFYLFFTDSSNIYVSLFFSMLVAIMVSSIAHGSWFTKVFELYIFRYIGWASFSIYLFHVPIIHIFETVISPVDGGGYSYLVLVFCTSTIIPCFFYSFYEQRLNISLKIFLTKKYEGYMNN